MNEAEIRGYIQRKLGECVVGVELTTDQIDDAISDAKLWFASYIGQVGYATLTLDGNNEYDVIDGAETVVDVFFPSDGNTILDVFSWAGVKLGIDDIAPGFGGSQTYGGYGCGAGRSRFNSYSGLVQYMQYLELAKYTVSADRDWEWDRSRRKLIVSPSFDAGVMIAYLYMTDSIDLSKLIQAEQKLVRDYAYAESLITLGNIRTKFSDLPSAQGSFTMNGDTMFANGQEMKADLDEKILRIREPVPFILG